MEELLLSWGVSQNTVTAFRDNNIDITCLDGLGEEELKILIPDNLLRDRIKFKMGYKIFKTEIETVHSNTDSLVTSDAISLSSCELFSDENKCYNEKTYYVPSRTIGPKNTMPAQGKLVDRYYNQMRNLRGSGVLPKKRKFDISDNENTDNDFDTQIEEQREQMQWLKYNRDHWPLVEEKWKATCAYRKKKTYDSADNKLTMMFNEWPCLKATNGHRLIEIDFIYLYPQKNLLLFDKWHTFVERSLKLLESTIADELKEHLEDSENTRNFAICSSLPYKMKPTSKIYSGEKNKFNKVSIAESQQSFIMNVKNDADIEEILQNRRKSYSKKGLTCQPMILCLGTPQALEVFYVVVDDVKYRFDSLTKALDACFKCFIVLNLAYPKECEQLWLFIQQYFYEIHLTVDKNFSQVTSFIKLLEE